jgi:hypothetical protein
VDGGRGDGLREGYAQVLTVWLNTKYQITFLACHEEAREAGRGP